MSWVVMKMGNFLKHRDLRFKPKDPKIKGLKRIEKIDFSGNIFISDKPSNTDMVLVKKGDLIISGINVEKGAMAVYQGDEDITATIHYSSYEFDDTKIDIDYLKNFLRSKKFTEALKEQVAGGIKTEIKPKHLLPLEVEIPIDIEEQREIIKNFEIQIRKVEHIDSENNRQLDLLKKLRQQILQDAVQGKLVAQDPNDEPASVLLERIKAEKEKLVREKQIKKEKQQPPLKPEEIPFEIPENWVWCKLGDVAKSTSTGPFGSMLHKADYIDNGIPLINPMNIIDGKIVASEEMMISDKTKERLRRYELFEKDIVIGRRGEMGRCAVISKAEEGWLCGTGCFFIRLTSEQNCNYFTHVLRSKYASKYLLGSSVGETMNNLNHRILNNLIFPLPPLKEQNRIIVKVEQLLLLCDELEQSVQQNQKYTQELLQVALKEALEVKHN